MSPYSLLPIALLASGMAIAATPETHKEATTTGVTTPTAHYSFQDADRNKDGMMDEAEYDEAVSAMRTELDGFKSKMPSRSALETEPAGSPGDMPAADADPSAFKNKGAEGDVVKETP